MKYLFLSFCACINIYLSAQDRKNPDVWARFAIEQIRKNNADSIVGSLYLTQEQLKTATIMEMDAAGYVGSAREKLADNTFLSNFYLKSKADFTEGIKHSLSKNPKLKWDRLKIKKIKYDFVLPKTKSDDIEILWPLSKEHRWDESITTLARINVLFKANGKRYEVRFQPVFIDGVWRLLNPFYFIE